MSGPRYLLLQIRDERDPMRQQEVACFARAIDCRPEDIRVRDLLKGPSAVSDVAQSDMVLIGGSGDYSAVDNNGWLNRALDLMRTLYHDAKPTFASCWGFQALSRALGGEVIHDAQRLELGTNEVRVTEEGRTDPVFSILGPRFWAHMGHADRVTRIPPDAVLLASTDRVRNQAFCFRDRPLYATQFHPELDRKSLLQRVKSYPEYIKMATGMTLEEFDRACRDTPAANRLIRRFVEHFLPRKRAR